MEKSSAIDSAIESICRNYLPLSANCREDLANRSKLLVFDKLSTLVKEGQYADKTYFIINGCARAYYLKDGKDITDWFAFENDFISSINSFFLNVPSPHFIEVLEPGVLLEILRADVLKLSDIYPDFDRLGKMIVTKTMLQLQQRIVAIQFETAQQKYENLIKIRPGITQRVPLGHIASYLGITFETLSRIRNPKNRI
jgi:CRP-like cAMP-binding protein